MLNVSRTHLVKLLESGALPFHKAGEHRRIRFSDLMSYKAVQEKSGAPRPRKILLRRHRLYRWAG